MTDTVYRRRGDPALAVAEVLPDPRTLYLMAQDLLTRLRSCAVEQGVTLPDRQFVYPSPVPADCEQAVVLFSGWSPLPPWDTLTHCDAYRWVGNFSVIITRCTPAIPSKRSAIPPVDLMNGAALLASQDAEVMLCLVASIDEVGTELTVITTPPQGGFQTTELDVQIPAYGGLE